MHTIKQHGQDFLNLGYNIIPTKYQAKTPLQGLTNWTKIQADVQQVNSWIQLAPNSGIGILSSKNPGIDIDVLDPQIVNELWLLLSKEIGKPFASRVGQFPKTLIPCQLPVNFEPYNKLKTNIYIDIEREKEIRKEAIALFKLAQTTVDLNSAKAVAPTELQIQDIIKKENKYGRLKSITNAMEILGDGQMYIAEGFHPLTKSYYTWDIPIPESSKLPVLTPRLIDVMFNKFEELAQELVAKGKWKLKESSINAFGLSTQLLSTSQFSKQNSISITPITQHTTSNSDELNLIPALDPVIVNTTSLAQIRNKKRIPTKQTYSKQEIQNMLDKIPPLDHDDWLHLGMAIHYETGGSQEGLDLFKYFSKRHPGYDEAEIETRYPTFNKDINSKGYTIGTVIALYQQSLPKPEKTPTVYQTDHPYKELESLPPEKRPWYYSWYFISTRAKFFNQDSKRLLSPDAFNYEYKNILRIQGHKTKPADYAANEGLIPPVYIMMYMPGAYKTGIMDNNTYVNTYIPYVPKGEKPLSYTEPKTVQQFFDKLIPNEMERDVVMYFMSYVLQNPGKRINWAPLLLGVEGTGKTTLFEMMRACIGRNARTVSASAFISSFNTFAEGAQFNFVEEVRIAGSNRYKALDIVKELITNNNISVTPKGVNTYEVINVSSYMMATNHADAIPIEDTNRRYTVAETVRTLTGKDFADIYDTIENDAHNLHDFFKRVDTQAIELKYNFNAYSTAPITPSTLAMINNTADPMIEAIQKAIESNSIFCNHSLISFSILKEKLTDMETLGDKSFVARLRTKLLSMGWTRGDKTRYKINNMNHVLYQPNLNNIIKNNLPQDCFEIALTRARTSDV